MLAYVKENNVKSAAVIGGGLLGLEAAKAVKDMGVTSHIIEVRYCAVRVVDKVFVFLSSSLKHNLKSSLSVSFLKYFIVRTNSDVPSNRSRWT